MTRELVLSTVITLLLLGPIRCQKMLGDPCAEAGEPVTVVLMYQQ